MLFPVNAERLTILYHKTNPLLPLENCDNKFRLDIQGGLVQVKLIASLPKRTTKTVAADAKKWDRLRMKAIRPFLADSTDPTSSYKSISARIAWNTNREGVDTLARNLMYQKSLKPAPRGAIVEFSRKSRMRLLQHTARLASAASGLFLTVTYRENIQDHQLAKYHLDLLLRWLKKHYSVGSFMWRMEYQKRGAIHFHIIALNVNFIPIETLTAYWQKMTGDDSYPDISSITSRRKVMGYVSKYIAKPQVHDPTSEASGFINLPYSDFIGRYWGIVNRKCLPLAVRRRLEISAADDCLFNTLRRYARHKWRKLSRRFQGFTLFVDDALQWGALFDYEMLSYMFDKAYIQVYALGSEAR